MNSNNMQEWFVESERQWQAEDEGRAELARLAMITIPNRGNRSEEDSFGRDAWFRGYRHREMAGTTERWPLAKPVGTITRLALLLGAGTIASLAVWLG
jgi:hypothetical protein